jgi:tetratricopeptide (TPR) repeat protein
MKFIITACLLLQTYILSAQLKFETPFYDALNKWVLFDSKNENKEYILGYIYIDGSAGYSLRYNGLVVNDDSGLKLVSKPEESLMVYRLDGRTSSIYVLNDQNRKSLNLNLEPDYFENYKFSNPLDLLYKQGNLLNGMQLSKAAIKPLEELYSKNKNYKGLSFELGYAYNATGAPEKGISILEEYLKGNNNDYWAMKELMLAYLLTNNLENAKELYNQIMKIAPNNSLKAEVSSYIARAYFDLKDKENFEKWIAVAESYSNDNIQVKNYIQVLKNNFKQ